MPDWRDACFAASFALSRLAWLRPRFACLASCFVAGFCRKTVAHFSGTCLAKSGQAKADARLATKDVSGRYDHHRHPNARSQAAHPRRYRRMGSDSRPGSACAGYVRGKAVFGCFHRFRRRAERECQHRGRCHAGHAAGDQRGVRAPGDPHGPRAQGADQSQVGLRPEELFLPGPSAGLSDFPVQAAHRRGGDSHRFGRPRLEGAVRGHRSRHRAAASGAGRRQVDARPASDHVLCRSQSIGRGADGDRVEAGHALLRRGQGVSDQTEDHRALPRHLRRQHGRRVDARRRQRVGAQAGRDVRHALRDQERQLHPLRRPGDRI